MKIISIAALMLLITSCSGVPITEGGKRVRSINPDGGGNCKFMGTDEVRNAWGSNPEQCRYNAEIAMRNRTAEVGGNAYHKTFQSSGYCLTGGTVIQFDVYDCP